MKLSWYLEMWVAGLATQVIASKSFAGSNNYYLHAMLPEEQADYISSLRSDGAKVVRLWGKIYKHSI